jgi:ABC-2 type transport system ATP-binding protein
VHAIEVRDLCKSYSGVKAVDGATFSVSPGECLALLGPNGAGKTTTTEILEGYRKADSGRVRVLGQDPAYAGNEWKSRIGIVLQSDRDLGDLTVVEALRHFAGYFTHPRDVEEVIASVGLEEKAGSRNSKLSGGQRRRLDVALGIIGGPEVLFLDEPTTGFDPASRREFWTLIERLKSDGTTVLLTTHYLEEAEKLADRVAIMARGRVVALDTPAQIGGRSDATALVSWAENDIWLEVRTDVPTALVGELSARFEGEIPQLAIRRPTLEDMYLSLLAKGEQQ